MEDCAKEKKAPNKTRCAQPTHHQLAEKYSSKYLPAREKRHGVRLSTSNENERNLPDCPCTARPMASAASRPSTTRPSTSVPRFAKSSGPAMVRVSSGPEGTPAVCTVGRLSRLGVGVSFFCFEKTAPHAGPSQRARRGWRRRGDGGGPAVGAGAVFRRCEGVWWFSVVERDDWRQTWRS